MLHISYLPLRLLLARYAHEKLQQRRRARCIL